jgi:hypothetical protein
MRSGLDQFLANQITRQGVFKVVADPKLADAIFTDRLGSAFEEAMAEMYPPKKETGAGEEKEGEEAPQQPDWDVPGSRVSTFSRGRGNVFLVERASLGVLWSFFNPVRSTRPDELNRTAEDIVERLSKDVKKITATRAVQPPPVVDVPAAKPPEPEPQAAPPAPQPIEP